MATAGPKQRRAMRLVTRGAVGNARASVTKDSRAVEGYGGVIVADVRVRGGDADGLTGFQGGAPGRGEDTTAYSTGIHFLELEEGLILLWRGGNGHRNCRCSQYHWINHIVIKIYGPQIEEMSSPGNNFAVVM